jgi:phage virion morphogenesis protein
MSASIEFDPNDIKNFRRRLKALGGGLDYNALVDEVTTIQLARIRKRFHERKDSDGVRWSDSNAALQRALSGRGGATLYDTGHLFRSIQATQSFMSVAAITTDVPYAKTHQYGLNGMPKREFLGFSDDDVEVAQGVMFNFVIKAVNAVGVK